MSPKFDVEAFDKNGFAIVKSVFSRQEIADFRQQFLRMRKNAALRGATYSDKLCPTVTYVRGDLLGMDELRESRYICLDDRVLSIVRQVIGPKLVYFGDSSVQFGEGQRGFHKDNVDRSDPAGPDWKDRYTVVRFAIYLQDHAHHSGGLKVRVGSHRFVSRHQGRAVNLPTEEGDLAIWFLTTSHSGNNVRFRVAPGLCLHPRVETKVPYSLRVPEQKERISVFCSFGVPDKHLDRYIQYQVSRGDYHEHWRRSGGSEAHESIANDLGVEIRRPIGDYGCLCARPGRPLEALIAS